MAFFIIPLSKLSVSQRERTRPDKRRFKRQHQQFLGIHTHAHTHARTHACTHACTIACAKVNKPWTVAEVSVVCKYPMFVTTSRDYVKEMWNANSTKFDVTEKALFKVWCGKNWLKSAKKLRGTSLLSRKVNLVL